VVGKTIIYKHTSTALRDTFCEEQRVSTGLHVRVCVKLPNKNFMALTKDGRYEERWWIGAVKETDGEKDRGRGE